MILARGYEERQNKSGNIINRWRAEVIYHWQHWCFCVNLTWELDKDSVLKCIHFKSNTIQGKRLQRHYSETMHSPICNGLALPRNVSRTCS